MKKLFLLIAASFVMGEAVNAQTTAAYLKRETATLKKDIRHDKKVDQKMDKEARQERRKLRKLEGNEVSYQSKQAFATDFSNITPISSQRLDNFDEFTFTTKKGITKSAYYDPDSKLVGTVEDKTFADLPSQAQKAIRDQYKDYTPGDVILFDSNEPNITDMILYGLQFESQDSYFIEMKKSGEKIVLQVKMDGEVSFFTQLT
ncbi:MAG: hypothetical protein ABI288_09450 [Ginsengibacter sp.]